MRITWTRWLALTYEDYVDKVARYLKLISLYQKYRLHLRAAESWMEHVTVASADFLAQGRKHEKELGDLSVKIEPYEEHPLFNPLVPKVKQTLTNIRANILTSQISQLPPQHRLLFLDALQGLSS